MVNSLKNENSFKKSYMKYTKVTKVTNESRLNLGIIHHFEFEL